MTTKFLQCDEFDKDFKHLSKKYPSLEKDFQDVKDALEQNPIPPLTVQINNL
jgi:mRNA-degrading endonuclease YafQ of YafQ-DinJ toxin-antitoxin module